jgi:hypothetical protein
LRRWWHSRTTPQQQQQQQQHTRPTQPCAQERITAAVRLTTPEEELYAFTTMWELQPFVDDRVIQALQEWASGDLPQGADPPS